ncbi:trace amine-associated receptor 13c-like [Clupea harengus]|uniref:Trace amine-associated receptor 13c-like n=1 Tax=Clupea harengus TaxID=7950 RepID=A0A6P3W485_CLUHA|nr:trace amine-associated receptor 13c-like [Clupea harengus]
MDESLAVQYCYPLHNASCSKTVGPTYKYVLMYLIFSVISIVTVFVNLLVIISISHFKQLHTPTNLLILSLAVADLLIGLIVIPVEAIKLTETCWYFGQEFCFIFQCIVYALLSSSVGHLVVIAIDRYVAVSDPLLYIQRITVSKALISISLIWSCSVLYNLVLLYCNRSVHFSGDHRLCHGQCFLYISFEWGMFDIICSFVAPCAVMITLYLRIFQVATYQVSVINSISAGVGYADDTKMPRKSEGKAAKTLGIVVAVYLLCWIPYYLCLLTADASESSAIAITFLTWILYTNSCVNPLIYALFYSWFKTAVRHILTLKIHESSSSFLNLLSEDN